MASGVPLALVPKPKRSRRSTMNVRIYRSVAAVCFWISVAVARYRRLNFLTVASRAELCARLRRQEEWEKDEPSHRVCGGDRLR